MRLYKTPEPQSELFTPLFVSTNNGRLQWEEECAFQEVFRGMTALLFKVGCRVGAGDMIDKVFWTEDYGLTRLTVCTKNQDTMWEHRETIFSRDTTILSVRLFNHLLTRVQATVESYLRRTMTWKYGECFSCPQEGGPVVLVRDKLCESCWSEGGRKKVEVEVEETYVYFAIDETQDAVKIGFSRDPNARLNDLQVGNSNKLEMFGAVKAGFSVEGDLHRQFSSHHLRGEWFHKDPVLEWLRTQTVFEFLPGPYYRTATEKML